MIFMSRLRLAALLLTLTLPLAAQTPAPQTPPAHPTSTPYTGDFSVFEEAGRDQSSRSAA